MGKLCLIRSLKSSSSIKFFMICSWGSGENEGNNFCCEVDVDHLGNSTSRDIGLFLEHLGD